MPIRPENRNRYPADWQQISRRIRFERAAGRCECVGECGGKGHLLWLRLVKLGLETDPRCRNEHGQLSNYGSGTTVVVLTTAHLDHTAENCDDNNLKAMCQACHLAYDADHHTQTARATRAAELARQMEAML